MTQPFDDAIAARQAAIRAARHAAAPRTPRPSSRRQNLFAASMLVPVVATAFLAAGKIVARRVDISDLVQPAHAQPASGVAPRGGGFGQSSAPAGLIPPTVPDTGPEAVPLPPTTATGAPVTGTTSGATALTVLLEQANHWRRQQQDGQAIASLNRALRLDPDNVQALVLLGIVEADDGNRAAAQSALNRLRQVSPNDPGIAQIEQSLRIGAIPPDALAEARRLAREGRNAEAVQHYNMMFNGNQPPDRLALEYYQTLAGTSDSGWAEARDGLARLVQEHPNDLDVKLAYAEVLTYRDSTRAQGIALLAALAKDPSKTEQATAAWRQALDWLPSNRAAVDSLTVYLNSHPNDPQITAKLAAARNPAQGGQFAADPQTALRISAYDALNHGRLAEAEQLFQRAIAGDPNDADSVGGLGIVRLRQRRYGEARELLSRAIAMNPDHRGQWDRALAASVQAGRGGGGPGVGNQAAEAQTLINRGDYPAAERELKRQIARNIDRSGGLQAMLADTEAQQGRLGDAEASYRDALRLNPRNAGALVGLAGILSREGRSQEAQQMLAQAETMGAGRQVGQARALALREQAMEVRDPATQSALFREAVASDPANPWLRLDLARSLVRLGQLGEARSVMAQALGGRNAGVDALRANIIFANETHDPDLAASLIARLPKNAQTPELRVLQAQAGLERDIAGALTLPRDDARQRLLSMATQPDPDGVRGPAIARALNSLGDRAAAREALLIARRTTANATPAARLNYAGAFLDVGDDQDAAQTLRLVGSGAGLTPQQRQDAAQLQAGLAVRTSDRLNRRGQQADAYDTIAPLLARQPDNPDLNMALARLYQGAKDPKQALAIDEALVNRYPEDATARRAAMQAAIQAGEYGRAEEMAQQAIRRDPNNPDVWIAAGEVAKARGNNGRALSDYERARVLRQQVLAASGGAAAVPPPDAGRFGTPAPRFGAGAPGQGGAQGTGFVNPGYSTPAYGTPNYLNPAAGNPDGGADDSTVPPTPSVAPPNLYPEGVTPTSGAASAVGQSSPAAPPNYQIPHGRMLDTTPSDLPNPTGGAAPAVTAASPAATPAIAAAPTAAPASPPASGDASSAVANAAASLSVPRTAPTPAAPVQTAIAPVAVPAAPPAAPAATAPAVAQTALPPPAAPSQLAPAASAATVQYQPQYVPPPPVAETPAARFQVAQTPPAPLAPPPYPAAPAYPPPATFANTPIPPAPAPVAAGPSVLDPSGYGGNPFRQPSGIGGLETTSLPADAVTAEIDRNIISLQDEVAPALQAGLGFRARTGDPGLDRLTEFTVPLEAEFSPGGVGRLKLQVTPTVLDAGTISGINSANPSNLSRFGTGALYLAPGSAINNFNNVYVGTNPGSQNASGVGLDAAYSIGNFKADIGSTPLGFRVSNIVGGVEWAPALSDAVRLRLTAEQRAVNDSLLSYAGTVDPTTGQTWGGEVRDRGHANLEFTAGIANFYIGAGGGEVRGTHVPDNAEFDVGAGGSVPVFRGDGGELRAGLDLVYFGYEKNLRFFSYGQGGYFSPQSYAAALVPLTWRQTVDEDLNYEVGVSLGVQTYHEKSSPYYPDDPLLQSLLISDLAANPVPGQVTTYSGQTQTGFAGGGHARVDYRVAPNLHIGANVSIDHSGDYTEGTGLLYARYLFNGTRSQ